jgi:hypothetical protein
VRGLERGGREGERKVPFENISFLILLSALHTRSPPLLFFSLFTKKKHSTCGKAVKAITMEAKGIRREKNKNRVKGLVDEDKKKFPLFLSLFLILSF